MRAFLRPKANTCLFLLLTLLALSAAVARAADDDTSYDEYDENARVARVSLLSGDVQLKRNGSQSWEQARVNFPLVEGDTLATTGADSRLEIQIDARNFVRLGGDSVLRVVSLRYEGVALSLSEGTATVRLARFDRDKEYFEVDAPGTTLAAEKQGVYRLDVSRDGSVRLAVRDGGRARIYSETSGFTLRDGRSASLVYGGTNAGDWELGFAPALDGWDYWVDERERYLVSHLRYEGRDRYYDQDVWGAEELDGYGDWVEAGDYGWVWRPHTTVINNYYNWAPYRYGHWVWCPPYGWTWVGEEPWGWAPYHYGRWVYYNNNWCWSPRGYGYRPKRSWWRPALVVFVYVPTSYGERVCWYPLTYGQRDPRGRHYNRLEALRSGDARRLERTNPAFLRAVTSVPAREFGRHAARTEQAPAEIARRAANSEPVRGRLPIIPADGSTPSDTGDRRAGRAAAARTPSSNENVPVLRERPTGAGARTAGMPLDDELRRTRLYNNREPRQSGGGALNGGGSGSGAGSFGGVDPGGTGAVARPPRQRNAESQTPVRRPQDGEGNAGPNGLEGPARPPRINAGEGRPPSRVPTEDRPERPDPTGDDGVASPAPRVRPVSPRSGNEGDTPRPARRPDPQPEERPQPRPEPRYERPEPRPEPRPESRPEPRYERPEPRPEPRQEPRPEPRQEPRSEPRPAPPPQREERPSPPPQREEKPASPPPQRDSDTARPSRRGDDEGRP